MATYTADANPDQSSRGPYANRSVNIPWGSTRGHWNTCQTREATETLTKRCVDACGDASRSAALWMCGISQKIKAMDAAAHTEIAMDGYSGYVDALRRAGVAIADDIAARLDAK
jgi:hypothetical protein